jgi:hypothetical protein
VVNDAGGSDMASLGAHNAERISSKPASPDAQPALEAVPASVPLSFLGTVIYAAHTPRCRIHSILALRADLKISGRPSAVVQGTVLPLSISKMK